MSGENSLILFFLCNYLLQFQVVSEVHPEMQPIPATTTTPVLLLLVASPVRRRPGQWAGLRSPLQFLLRSGPSLQPPLLQTMLVARLVTFPRSGPSLQPLQLQTMLVVCLATTSLQGSTSSAQLCAIPWWRPGLPLRMHWPTASNDSWEIITA